MSKNNKTQTATVSTGSAAPSGIPNIADASLPPVSLPLGEVMTAVSNGIAAVQQVGLSIPGLVTINKGSKLKTVKPRPGSPALINEMAVAARAFPDLVGGGIDPQAIQDTLTYLQELKSMQQALEAMVQTINDTQFARLAGAWSETLDIYAALQRQVEKNPAVAPSLAAMTAYLAIGKKGSKKRAKAGSAASSTTSTGGTNTDGGSGGASATPTGGGSNPPGNGGGGNATSVNGGANAGAGQQTVPVYAPGGQVGVSAPTNTPAAATVGPTVVPKS